MSSPLPTVSSRALSREGAGWNLCAAIIIGRRCARLYASSIMGDESERMTLPIDMKKLEPALAEVELERG